MKLTIHTAHGYLSFQPNGRLEYRDVVGPWEEIDVEGLALAPPTVATPPIAAPPPVAAPPVTDVPYLVPSWTAGYVAAVKAQLESHGVDLSGPCGAFAITKRVVWGLRDDGAGLLDKPGGNQCDGYATDVVCFRNGDLVDILGDGGGANVPSWQVKPNEVDPSRWRPAVQP